MYNLKVKLYILILIVTIISVNGKQYMFLIRLFGASEDFM